MLNKKTYVGIDIGHHTIKAVQIDRNSGGWRIIKAGAIPTPKGAVREGIVHDTPTVGSAIKNLIQFAGITCKHAVISVQGSSVVVRTARMPLMPEPVLRKSIRYEAGRYIPNSVEDSYVEFEILGNAEDGQMDVLVVAAPKELVDSRIEACRDAGLEVEIVDVGPFAAYRALLEANDYRQFEQETIALIELGSNSTTVSVIANGIFSMTRSVQNGSANLTEALRTFFDLTPEDAEAGKCQLNISELLEESPRENPPLRVLHPYIDELVREIRRSINYYESQQVDGQAPQPIKSVVLTGGGSALQGTAEYLSSKLGVEVVTAGVFGNPRIVNFTPHELGQGFEWSVASGLAMRPFLKSA